MLYVVDEQNKILARFDAWDIDCEDKAIAFIRENGYRAVSDRITAMGDRVVTVR